MKALIFDKSKQDWSSSKGFILSDVPEPILDESKNPLDAESVIVKVKFAGICGTDRGIWYRQTFGEQILDSLKQEHKDARIIGHEMFGEIVKTGSKVHEKYGMRVGDAISCDSHIICNKCFQCKIGQKNVCTKEKIFGITIDGCFAEYVKVPCHIAWPTDPSKIRPEVAAVQDPFGNAVHAASKADLKGKTVAIFGLGPIGLFEILIVRGLGASKIIGIDPKPLSLEMAKKLGADHLITLAREKRSENFRHDEKIVQEIMKLTDGLGVDVSFEMAGPNSSVNNAVMSTRRGGDVILFGLKSGDFIIENFDRLIVRGVTLHAVIGREIFKTWETTKKILEDKKNHVQEDLYNIILKKGDGTIISIDDFTPELFEKKMSEHPKIVMKF